MNLPAARVNSRPKRSPPAAPPRHGRCRAEERSPRQSLPRGPLAPQAWATKLMVSSLSRPGSIERASCAAAAGSLWHSRPASCLRAVVRSAESVSAVAHGPRPSGLYPQRSSAWPAAPARVFPAFDRLYCAERPVVRVDLPQRCRWPTASGPRCAPAALRWPNFQGLDSLGGRLTEGQAPCLPGSIAEPRPQRVVKDRAQQHAPRNEQDR